ncbi:lysostaphin resistance A-like protein [Parvularcula marina]|uniref:CPBP family intramembrane glutamic endopeptidase n=1 Tax=Parvularcula marina TaxID=2292771 RepID=UPI0035198DE1
MTDHLAEPNEGLTRRLILTLTIIVVFVVADERAFGLYQALGIEIDWTTIRDRLFLVHSWQVVPPLIVALVFFGSGAFRALGLQANILTGLAVGFVCTLPMLLGYALFGTFNPGESPVDLFFKYALFPGVGEEIIYRGFLFGLLFRFAGWGFIPASLLCAISFGIAHMWQGSSPAETAGIVAITAVGAVWFSWLYIEWGNNLFVPITFHVLMNEWWQLFEISETALGGGVGNIFRFTTIGLSVVVTLMMAKRQGGSRLKGRWLLSR